MATLSTPAGARNRFDCFVPQTSACAAPVGIAPAQHALDDQTFTAVGYGLVRDTKTGGPHGFSGPEGIRRYALQTSLSLQKHWLTLSMQPPRGDGGTCYGDSGGPHFLGGVESNLMVSLTITGDTMCRATDETYRLDTVSVRLFLGQFVPLP